MGRTRCRLCLVAAALALVAAIPGAAAAATPKPFTLDAASGAAKPTIAVDSSGTAHVAWNVNNPGVADDTIATARVPRGKRACTGRLTLSAPYCDATSPPHVLLNGPGSRS